MKTSTTEIGTFWGLNFFMDGTVRCLLWWGAFGFRCFESYFLSIEVTEHKPTKKREDVPAAEVIGRYL